MTDPISTIGTDIKKVYTFGMSHIVLMILLVSSLLFGIYTFDSRRAERADAKAALAEANAKSADQRATDVIALNKQFQVDSATKEAAANQQVLQLQTQINALTLAISTRNTALVQQQKTDATLPPTQLANHWQDLIHVQNSVSTTQNGYNISSDGAVATVQTLESVPVLTQDITDLNKTLTDKDQQLIQEQTIVTLKQAENSSNAAACTAQLAAKDLDIKAKDTELTQVKADARKKNFKYMILGGFIVEGFRIWATGKP